MLSLLITDQSINKDHLMKICMVHDLAEAIVGDITPYDGVSKEEKRRLEEVIIYFHPIYVIL
jgi:putative hydrolase of HD superfamily